MGYALGQVSPFYRQIPASIDQACVCGRLRKFSQEIYIAKGDLIVT
jgi:hypothetical protein